MFWNMFVTVKTENKPGSVIEGSMLKKIVYIPVLHSKIVIQAISAILSATLAHAV